MTPTDDKLEIQRVARAISRSLRLTDKYTEFQNEIDNAYRVFFGKPKRLLKGAHFRALRFVRSRFTREEMTVLGQYFAEISDAPLLAIVRRRATKEKTETTQREHAETNRQKRALQIGVEVYSAQEEGASFIKAVEGSPTAAKHNLSPETVKKELQHLRAEAERRGFVDPLAAANAPLMGLLGEYEVPQPELTIERMKRRGRPPKNR